MSWYDELSRNGDLVLFVLRYSISSVKKLGTWNVRFLNLKFGIEGNNLVDFLHKEGARDSQLQFHYNTLPLLH